MQTTDVSFMPGLAVSISLHTLLIHGFYFVYFCYTSKEIRQNPATALINVQIIHSFWVLERFCHKIKQEKSQDRLGKDISNSLEITIKLKLGPTSTLRIGQSTESLPLIKLQSVLDFTYKWIVRIGWTI